MIIILKQLKLISRNHYDWSLFVYMTLGILNGSKILSFNWVYFTLQIYLFYLFLSIYLLSNILWSEDWSRHLEKSFFQALFFPSQLDAISQQSSAKLTGTSSISTISNFAENHTEPPYDLSLLNITFTIIKKIKFKKKQKINKRNNQFILKNFVVIK